MNDTSRLDEMMKNYCARKAQISFEVKEKEKTMKKGKRPGAIPMTAVCLVAVLTAGILLPQWLTGREISDKVPTGFSVTAYAAELTDSAVEISDVKAKLSSSDANAPSPDIEVSNGSFGRTVYIEPIHFELTGEKMESLDISCETGKVSYVLPRLKERMESGDSSITQDHYFKTGKSLKNIPYDSENPHDVDVMWNCADASGTMNETSSEENGDVNAGLSEDETVMELRTAEDFNRYFGDTITLTAHYADGSVETAVIAVGVDFPDGETGGHGIWTLQYQ